MMEWTTLLWASGIYWLLCLIYVILQIDAIGEKREIEVSLDLPQPA